MSAPSGRPGAKAPGPSVVTVGTYDGVHRGHQALLAASIAEGAAGGLPTVAVTFDPHPLSVLRPAAAPQLLTDSEHKGELIAAAGVDRVLVLGFDAARAAESAEDFVLEVLVRSLRARAVFVGTNFHFGHGARGDVALLSELGERFGFVAHGVDLVLDEDSGLVISSSRIRELVAAGDLAQTARLLGRPHEVRGGLESGPDGPRLLVARALALPPPGTYGAEVARPGRSGAAVTATIEKARPGAARVLVLSDALGELPSLGRAALRFGAAIAGPPAGETVGAHDEHGR